MLAAQALVLREGFLGQAGEIREKPWPVQTDLLGEVRLDLRQLDRAALGGGRFAKAPQVAVRLCGVLEPCCLVGYVCRIGRLLRDPLGKLADVNRHAVSA